MGEFSYIGNSPRGKSPRVETLQDGNTPGEDSPRGELSGGRCGGN